MADFDLKQQLAAQRLRQYGEQAQFQAPQGQMVGRHYVAPSALQYLASGLRSLGGMRGQDLAQQELTQLGEQKAQGTQKALAEFLRQSQGTPADTLPEGQAGPVRPAVAPNMHGAYSALMQAPEQNLRNMGMEGVVKLAQPKAQKWERVELPTPEGGKRVGFVDMNAQNPLSTFNEGGMENPSMSVGPAGQAYNPRTLTQGQVLADPNKPFMIGPDGKPVANSAFQGYELDKASRGASRNNVTVVNKGAEAFDVELAKLDAKQLDQWRDKAEQANQSLATARKLRDAEAKGAYAGGLADSKLAAANLINGITGIQPKGLVGSQLYNAEASKLVLEHIKQLGANPSNADREFIEKTVPRLATSKEARQQLVNFIEKSAGKTVNTFNQMNEYARKNRGLSGYQMPQEQSGVVDFGSLK